MKRLALLVATSEYPECEKLSPLHGSLLDVDAMQRVLVANGEFATDDVVVLKNASRQAIEDAIHNLFNASDRKKDDLVLFYFSGHGIVDEANKLFLGTPITRKEGNRIVKPTTVAATYLQDAMSDSKSQHQVLIFNCCFSGAFAQGMTVMDDGSVNLKNQLGGKGRAILTSSSSTQFSFQSDGEMSIYTRYLVEGIETGAADRDGDSKISIDELHEYAALKVSQESPNMTPAFYPVEQGGKIYIAKVAQAKDDPRLVSDRTQELTPPNSSFVGRSGAIAKLDELFKQHKLVLILGEGGRGKSTVVNVYCQKFKLHRFHKLGAEITNAESLVDVWLQELFGEEPSGQEFRVKLDRLRQYLIDDNQNICIVLDNLEPALENGRFKEEHHRYIALLEVLSNPLVKSVTLITSREPISENGIMVYNYELPELDNRAWCEYFQFHEIQVGEKALENVNSALNQMHSAYGGNAECMYIFSGVIEHSKDLVAYWETNKEDLLLVHPKIEGLIKRQFDVLQTNNPLAYKLLCRIGCYRYQDEVATVPEDGILAMLWNEPRDKAKRAIKNLRDRCLIKFSEQDRGYFLHRVMRDEAASRLKDEHGEWTEEGEKANREAAIFWSNSVFTVESGDLALRATESAKHFFAINDFDASAAEMIKRRKNEFYSYKGGEYLFDSVERLGLTLNLVPFIEKIVDNINPSEASIKAYQFLGGHYCLIGKLKEGLLSHERSKSIADQMGYLFYQINSRVMVGTGNLKMFDIESAHDSFSSALNLTESMKEDGLKYLRGYACFCLALAKSFQNEKNITAIENLLSQSEQIMCLSKLSTWGGAFYPLYSGMAYQNIGRFEIASEKYKEAINFAKESRFKQVEGIVTNLQASILRINKENESAIILHFKAKELLDEVGSIGDLPEVYFQLGLTYQAMGEHDQAEEYKAKALELFTQMEAPKQIERVNKAFGDNIQLMFNSLKNKT